MKFVNVLTIVSALRLPGIVEANLEKKRPYGGGDKTTRPSLRPSSFPSSSPTTCELECDTNNDCPRICLKPYNRPGTCVINPPTPTPPPNGEPSTGSTGSPTRCPCLEPPKIPDKCEVGILIDIMEDFFAGEKALFGQFSRAAFHDAGTFNQNTGEGGANGCLLNDPAMRLMPENSFLDAPLNTLQAIKDDWHDNEFTCIDVSSADMLQFAIFYIVHRQSGVPESLQSPVATATAQVKRNTVINFSLWGRPDADKCLPAWTHHLPGFHTPFSGPLTVTRCVAAGDEIEDKMMDTNGFTAAEANVLIGTHTIGHIRNTFGQSWNGPWVTSGADTHTPEGPTFNNDFHDFLINDIVADDVLTFVSNPPPSVDPFDIVFPDWFADSNTNQQHLDTDVILAFPSVGSHPHYRNDTLDFAADNDTFLKVYFKALDKMGRLGVKGDLFHPTDCKDHCTGEGGDPDAPKLTLDDTRGHIKMLGNATAFADAATTMRQRERKASGELDDSTTPTDTKPLDRDRIRDSNQKEDGKW
mmetsp:Transcript_3643/g.7042  ORF Transcript_3643/g.7042 Transcript_3643/m.7042 type:complete len:527 (+) Transcript_3643:76-1656(+)|eukprot:CAMPEP_0201665446 /NCGR_PEP_ID=MMETSP0494-20130426/6590_1 /ASSEMBLY_ACC=CAM_ASM_000839 /TAXON_ID=420259 /ORGANISM="Thalassiosira gravida, Strain GMp14c1" /LENGTH=526 /DNA_ID=CAMNT_0048144403 /DNA_START=17 /DNA_END=1597 /DNA_ORIENTATION=+